jgi:hypothetical protein
MVREPLKGEPVRGICFFCKRPPLPGEVYGPHAEGWDFTNICPECWNRVAAEHEEEDE